MNSRTFRPLVTLMALCIAGAGLATDRAEATIAMPNVASAEVAGIEVVGVEIRAGSYVLWSGTLRMGPQYGNASFSQSKSEFAEPCPGEPTSNGSRSMSNHQVSFNISRRNWQQEPDKFNVNVNWTQPLSACEGEGSNSLGFQRVIEVKRGGSATIEGAGSLRVTISRQD